MVNKYELNKLFKIWKQSSRKWPLKAWKGGHQKLEPFYSQRNCRHFRSSHLLLTWRFHFQKIFHPNFSLWTCFIHFKTGNMFYLWLNPNTKRSTFCDVCFAVTEKAERVLSWFTRELTGKYQENEMSGTKYTYFIISYNNN